MEPDNNGFSHSWNWRSNDFNHHPYTYTWARVIQDQWQNGNRAQQDLEWELAQIELMDYVVEQMTSYPEAEAIIERVKNLNA